MIIRNYVLKEIIVTLVAVLGILLLIFTTNHFARYLGEVASGELPKELVFQSLALLVAGSLVLMVPFVLYFSILTVFGRLYTDNEMAVLNACGVGNPQLLKASLWVILPFCFIEGVLSLYVTPWSFDKTFEVRDTARALSKMGGIAAGEFKFVNDGEVVFYTESISDEGQALGNVFVVRREDNRQDVITAKGGHQFFDGQSHDRYMVLENGYRYQGLPGQPNYTVHQYEELGLLVETPEVIHRKRKSRSLPLSMISGSNNLNDIAELQWRFSLPLATFMLGLLAVLYSRTSPRQGRYARLFSAILIYLIYTNLLVVAQDQVSKGIIPSSIGLWWVHLLMLLFVAGVYIRQEGGRWLWQLLTGKGVAKALTRSGHANS